MEKQSFFDYCKEYIMDNLSDYEGQEVYMCDLGITITEGPNADGTLTYSTAEAKEYIRAWWDEAGEYAEYEKFNFGEIQHNVFENPEAYMVCMVIEGVRSILAQCPAVSDDDNWNSSRELTPELIETIKNEVQEVTEVRW